MQSKQLTVRKTIKAKKNKVQPKLRDLLNWVLPKGHLFPDSVTVWLTFIDGNYLRNNAGAQYLVYALTVNNPPDVDPLILSGSVTGFPQWNGIYRNWRPLHIHHHFEIANNETFPVIWGMVTNETSLVSLPPNRDAAVSLLEQDNSTKGHLLSGTGGMNRATVDIHVDLGKHIIGNKTVYMADSQYEGTNTSNIPTPISSSLIVASTTSSNLANGVSTAWSLHMQVKFYNRQAIFA